MKAVTKRKAKRPLAVVASLICLVGIVMCFTPGWVMGVVLVVAGLAMDSVRRYVCGACGNRIEKTSVMCPVCQTRLGK